MVCKLETIFFISTIIPDVTIAIGGDHIDYWLVIAKSANLKLAKSQNQPRQITASANKEFWI
jgi:hypothetical protein